MCVQEVRIAHTAIETVEYLNTTIIPEILLLKFLVPRANVSNTLCSARSTLSALALSVLVEMFISM